MELNSKTNFKNMYLSMYILYIFLLLLINFFSFIWIFYMAIKFRGDFSLRGPLIWRFFLKSQKDSQNYLTTKKG